jgi:hypothetical protein
MSKTRGHLTLSWTFLKSNLRDSVLNNESIQCLAKQQLYYLEYISQRHVSPLMSHLTHASKPFQAVGAMCEPWPTLAG